MELGRENTAASIEGGARAVPRPEGGTSVTARNNSALILCETGRFRNKLHSCASRIAEYKNVTFGECEGRVEGREPQATSHKPQGKKIPLFPPFIKGDDPGCIPSGCATMFGSYLTGPPRETVRGGKGGFFSSSLVTDHWSLRPQAFSRYASGPIAMTS